MLIRVLTLLCAVGFVFAYTPKPKSVTPGEQAFEAALAGATTDEAKVALAREYLDEYPDDIAVARQAQRILNRKSDTPPGPRSTFFI